jgi:hypothetical protein
MTRPDYFDSIEHVIDPFTGADGAAIWAFFMAAHDGELETV